MHVKLTAFTVPDFDSADGVEATIPSGGVPFLSGEMMVVVGVNDGVFALSERYAAEWIAESETAIEKQRQHCDAFKPGGNSDSEFDDPVYSGDSELVNCILAWPVFWPGAKKKAFYN